MFLFQILGKSLRVDHVHNYKAPKDDDRYDDETKRLHEEGCAPQLQLPSNAIKREPIEQQIVGGVRLPARLPIGKVKTEDEIKKEPKETVRKWTFIVKYSMCLLRLYFSDEKRQEIEKE